MPKSQVAAHQNIIRLIAIVALIFLSMGGSAKTIKKYSAKDLDVLMDQAWQQSEVDLDNLRNYVFNERDVFNCNWCGKYPAAAKNFRREYVWTIRDNHFVRSLVRNNGKDVSVEEQKQAEEEWINDQRNQKAWRSCLDYFADFLRIYIDEVFIKLYKDFYPKNLTIGDAINIRYESEKNVKVMMQFPPGRYRFAGEQNFQGRNLPWVQYVILNGYRKVNDPTITLRNDPNAVDASISGRDIVSLPNNRGITSHSDPRQLPTQRHTDVWAFDEEGPWDILIDPDEHQLIRLKYPAKSTQRGEVWEFSMVMDKPLDNVWLPKVFSITAKVNNPALRGGSLQYTREFYSYSRSNVRARFWSEDVKAKIWYDMDEHQPKQ